MKIGMGCFFIEPYRNAVRLAFVLANVDQLLREGLLKNNG